MTIFLIIGVLLLIEISIIFFSGNNILKEIIFSTKLNNSKIIFDYGDLVELCLGNGLLIDFWKSSKEFAIIDNGRYLYMSDCFLNKFRSKKEIKKVVEIIEIKLNEVKIHKH